LVRRAKRSQRAIDYAKFRSRSHGVVIRVYDESGNVIEMPSTRAISKSRKVFCSRHVALPAKMKFHDSALSGGHERSQAD
jgi:hypothetical protein